MDGKSGRMTLSFSSGLCPTAYLAGLACRSASPAFTCRSYLNIHRYHYLHRHHFLLFSRHATFWFFAALPSAMPRPVPHFCTATTCLALSHAPPT